MAEVSGSKSGSFTIPTIEETSANVFYRFHLRVTDSGGLTRSVSRDIQPRKSTITLATNPAGLQLRLDGQPVTAPHSFVGVEGIVRSLEAVSPQGASWVFSSWSDGGARVHNISTPTADTTYTAQYVAQTVVSIAIANVSILEGDAGTKTAVVPGNPFVRGRRRSAWAGKQPTARRSPAVTTRRTTARSRSPPAAPRARSRSR